MNALIIALLFAGVVGVGAGTIFTGVVRTPILDAKYSALDGYVSQDKAVYEPQDALSFERKITPPAWAGTGVFNSEVVVTESEINSYINLKVLPFFSLKSVFDSMPPSLQSLLSPVFNIAGFNINDVHFTLREGEVVVSGHLADAGRMPFYIRSGVEKVGDSGIKVNVDQASLGLINIGESQIGALNTTINSNIQKGLQSVKDYKIETLEIRNGEVYYKGTLPPGL
jgi:hypothetical protein